MINCTIITMISTSIWHPKVICSSHSMRSLSHSIVFFYLLYFTLVNQMKYINTSINIISRQWTMYVKKGLICWTDRIWTRNVHPFVQYLDFQTFPMFMLSHFPIIINHYRGARMCESFLKCLVTFRSLWFYHSFQAHES